MSASFRRLRGLGYRRARLLLLAIGLVVLVVIGALTYVRRVESVEVAATLLFIPIFVAVVLWRVLGGFLAALLATGAYALLRAPAIELVGVQPFLGLLGSRAAAFAAFGLIGGWATAQLEGAIRKQELYDQIDDATGLYNARFFLHETDLEMARAKRYRTIFSVSAWDIPAGSLEGLSSRRSRRLFREIGGKVREMIRTVDRAAHARGDAYHRIAVILPETGPEGANVFTERLVTALSSLLSARGVAIPEGAAARTYTLPDDEGGIQALRKEFAQVDRVEHPEAPASTENP